MQKGLGCLGYTLQMAMFMGKIWKNHGENDDHQLDFGTPFSGTPAYSTSASPVVWVAGL